MTANEISGSKDIILQMAANEISWSINWGSSNGHKSKFLVSRWRVNEISGITDGGLMNGLK